MESTNVESGRQGRVSHLSYQQKGPRYWQDNYLRSRTSTPARLVYPYPQPLLSSTPIPNKTNQYANTTNYIYHQQETFYYNYPMVNHTSTSGLTQVLATYAPGATILCMDSKDKQSFRLSPNVRSIVIGIICLVILGGMTCTLCIGGDSIGRMDQVPVGMDRSKNSSFAESLPEAQTQTLSNERIPSSNREPLPKKSEKKFQTPERIHENEIRLLLNQRDSLEPPMNPPTTIIYSFDDDDRDNEAHVETIW